MSIPVIISLMFNLAYIFLTSLLPIIELRGAIPLGILKFNLPIVVTSLVAILGSTLIALPILLILSTIQPILERFSLIRWFMRRAIHKSRIIEEIGFLGLVIFIGIPLPMTGTWTGVTGGFLLGLRKREIILASLFGNIISGMIVTIVTILIQKGITNPWLKIFIRW